VIQATNAVWSKRDGGRTLVTALQLSSERTKKLTDYVTDRAKRLKISFCNDRQINAFSLIGEQ
jgi:hypothetical protein